MNSLKWNPNSIDDARALGPAQSKNAKRLDTSRQAHQNTTALRQPLTIPGQREPSEIAEDGIGLRENTFPRQVESIRELSKHMDELRREHSHYADGVRALEIQINESEAACGRMLQTYLELGRAITLRQKQLQEDRKNLQRVQEMKESKGRELDVVLTKISDRVSGEQDGP